MLNGPVTINAGTVTLVDGQLQTVTLTSPMTINAGSNLDFEVGNGSDEIALSGSGSLVVAGASAVNLYPLSGQVTSGTDVLIGGTSSGSLSLGNVYNTGNFTYSLASTATSEDVIVTAAATPLSTAYWKGGQNNIWSVLVGGTATNWTTDQAGSIDPLLTPSATTDVNFSANTPANEGNTVLGTDMTIKSLTISDTNAVVISGSDINPSAGTGTLTISGTTGTMGINVNSGAGLATINANLYLSGSSQTVTVNNAAGLVISGSVGSSNGLNKAGSGTLTLTGYDAFAGPTTVSNGTLVLGGTLSTGSAFVAEGGMLEADGLLNGGANVSGTLCGIGSTGAVTVNAGGTLAPGFQPGVATTGTLTANGNVTLAANSTFSIRLGVNVPTDHDQLTVGNGGTVSLDGANLQLTIGWTLNFPEYIGSKFVIIDGGAATTGSDGNVFAQGSSFTTAGGYDFDIFYATDANGDGAGTGDDVVVEMTGIPEPGTWAMVVSGMAILVLFGRSRRKALNRPQ